MNLRNKISNPPYLANSQNAVAASTDMEKRTSANDLEFWQQVKNDIVTLAEIIKNGDEEGNQDNLSFLSKHTKKKLK